MIDSLLDPDSYPDEDWGFDRDLMPNLENLRDHVQGILEAVYKTGDIRELENSLDEVCIEIGIPMNAKNPLIEKRGNRNMKMWHLGYQRAMLDQNHKEK